MAVDYSTTGIVTKPIVLTAVAKLLRTNIRDVGRLCTSGNVNKWSKHKPVRNSALFPTGETHWRGNLIDVIWGMDVDTADGKDGSVDDMYEDLNYHYNWSWAKPNGAQGYPYRLGDFDGYIHKQYPIYANNFVKDVKREEYISNSSTVSNVYRFSVYSSKNANSVKLSDLETIYGNKVALVASVYMGTSESTLSFQKDVILNNIVIGNYADDDFDGYEEADDDDEEYRFVDVQFNEDDMWGYNGQRKITVYLSLGVVKYESGRWAIIRYISLPYTDEQYYKTVIEFKLLQRAIEPQHVQYKDLSQSEPWALITDEVNFLNTNLLITPRIHFTVAKLPTEIMMFSLEHKYAGSTYGGNGSIYHFETRYTDRNGVLHTSVSKFIKASNASQIAYVLVDTGDGGTVDVYCEFEGAFVESGDSYPSGQYTAELYLITEDINNNIKKETRMGNLTIRKQ